MARVAHREGYPEIGLYWEKAAHEEAEHAAKFARDAGRGSGAPHEGTTKDQSGLGALTASSAPPRASLNLAACAKKNGLDAIHDTVHEMAKDEARHGKALQGMLNRYFAKEIALEKAAAKANKAAAVVSDAVTTAAEKLSEIIKK